jgi:hypothetical protein
LKCKVAFALLPAISPITQQSVLASTCENSIFSKEAVVNTYDKKNQFKKTTKKIK